MITVTDADTCRVFDYYSFIEPEALDINLFYVNETSENSNNGSATVTPVGGISPYFYMWSNGSTSEVVSDLAPGDYSVTVVDSNNCTIVDSFTISAYACPPIEVQKTSKNITCFGDCDGQISLQVFGGVFPYSYEWNDGSETGSISNLCPGTYIVTVSDGNSCTVIDTTIITEDELLILELDIKHEFGNNTNDGAITTTVSGGAMPYQYLWNTGDTTSFLDSIPPGLYSLTLTDANDCQFIEENILVEEFDCFSISINYFVEDIDCYGDCTGSIGITNISEGTFPFQYAWSNGETGNSIIDKCAGTYTLTLTDANDCLLIQSWDIVQPPEYTIDLTYRNEVGQNQQMDLLTLK